MRSELVFHRYVKDKFFILIDFLSYLLTRLPRQYKINVKFNAKNNVQF